MFQDILFPPESTWTAPRLSALPQDWNVTPRMGLDTETCDPLLKKLGPGVRRGAYIAGISFALSKDRGWYLPLRHLGGGNVESPERALEYVRDQARNYRGELVGAKISYDLDFLAEIGIEFPNVRAIRDVQVAEPLLDELQLSYSLDNILARHGMELKDERMLREAATQYKVDPKKEMWKLPARFVGQYAEVDAIRPLELLERQEAELEARGLMKIWDLETQVLPVLVKMRRRGVRVDFDRLDRVERYANAEEMKAWGELHKLTGVAVRVGDAMKPEVLAHALSAVGIRVGKTTQGKPSITKDFLENLNHPAGAIIRRARKMSQLRTTFVNSIRQHAIPHGDEYRIHCTFNQTVIQDDDDKNPEGARPGRLSCVDPNLQQQPARDPELGPMWRGIYRPDVGAEWGSADFSQQEPRLAVHFAVISGPKRIGEAAYRSAVTAAQRYWDDRSTDAHTMFTQMVYGESITEDPKKFKIARNRCKNIFLGICYGMGGVKLCGEIGLPTKIVVDERTGHRREVAGDEGQALLNLVDSRVPYVRKTAKAVEKAAKEKGYIVTIGGRHCHFPKDPFGNFDWTHKAFNRAIQGSAADQTKIAMVELDRAGAYLQLQIHDEFAMSINNREEGLRYAKIMEECVPLKVPSKVDLEVGPSWGEAA